METPRSVAYNMVKKYNGQQEALNIARYYLSLYTKPTDKRDFIYWTAVIKAIKEL